MIDLVRKYKFQIEKNKSDNEIKSERLKKYNRHENENESSMKVRLTATLNDAV